MKTRDMSQREFDEACKRRGFVPSGFLGYYSLPAAPNRKVSVLNAGESRRAQLAYLIRENEEAAKEVS